MIELKNSLQGVKMVKGKPKPSTLDGCQGKFQAGLNRLYMLLSINDYKNPKQRLDNQTIETVPHGIIFYNQQTIKGKDNSDLYQILIGENTLKLWGCETLLTDRDKVKIAFYQDKKQIKLIELLG